MEKLRKRWGLKSNWGILAILIAFSINGSFAAFIVKPTLALIGVSKDNLNIFVYYLLYLIPVFVVYQFTLPYSGWLVGQYSFFKNMQNRITSRMKRKS